jgi:hypothetical protein
MSDYQLPKKAACIITTNYCRLGYVLFVIIRKGGFSQPDLNGYGMFVRGITKIHQSGKTPRVPFQRSAFS